MSRPRSSPRVMFTSPRAPSPHRQRAPSPQSSNTSVGRRARSLSPEKDVAHPKTQPALQRTNVAQTSDLFDLSERVFTQAYVKRPPSTSESRFHASVPSTPRVGLRGVLPDIDKTTTTTSGALSGTELFKFRMTHAAIMNNIKSTSAQRHSLSLPEANQASDVTTVVSPSIAQSLCRDDLSLVMHTTQSADSPIVDSASQPRDETAVSDMTLASGFAVTGGPFFPTKLSHRPANGVNITANSVTKGRQYVLPTTSPGKRTSPVTASSIPARHVSSSEHKPEVVGVAVKRNERAS